jgi:cleavage and polyadenylation specificity factor subunit 1
MKLYLKMHAIRRGILPASGVEFATSLKLTTSTIHEFSIPPNTSARHEFVSRVLCNVAVARSSLLHIFEVREELALIPTQGDDERERKSKVRRGTEAVEGEVAMDEQGEGHVNIAKVIRVFYISCSIKLLLPCWNNQS